MAFVAPTDQILMLEAWDHIRHHNRFAGAQLDPAIEAALHRRDAKVEMEITLADAMAAEGVTREVRYAIPITD